MNDLHQAEPRKKLKRYTILALFVLLAVLAITLAPIWVSVELHPDAAIVSEYEQTGGSHFVFLSLSLAIAATLIALSLGGLVIRYILGTILLVLNAGLFYNTLNVIQDPFSFVAEQLAKHTGIRGPGLKDMIISIDLSFWPWLTLLSSGLFMCGGVFLLARAHQWPVPPKRYSREGEEEEYQNGWGTFERDDDGS